MFNWIFGFGLGVSSTCQRPGSLPHWKARLAESENVPEGTTNLPRWICVRRVSESSTEKLNQTLYEIDLFHNDIENEFSIEKDNIHRVYIKPLFIANPHLFQIFINTLTGK